jgi:hypothetical protein
MIWNQRRERSMYYVEYNAADGKHYFKKQPRYEKKCKHKKTVIVKCCCNCCEKKDDSKEKPKPPKPKPPKRKKPKPC